MIVRTLGLQEILPALHLVWEVFVADVAPGYTAEGVAEFQKFIKYENMMQQIQNRELVMFGVWEGQELLGVSALHVKKGGHIALFFVKKEWQNRGVGKMLFQEMSRFCVSRLKINRITVNAAPDAAVVFGHFGMYAVAPEQNVNGMRFVPMELLISDEMAGIKKNKGKKALLITAIVAGVILTMVLIVAGMYGIIRETRKELMEEMPSDVYEMPYDDEEDSWDNWDNWDEEEMEGLDAIPEYKEPGVTYEITDEVYAEEAEDTKKTTISFEVYYPQITGLDESVQKKVNEKLKECAMETAEAIYLNPSTEMKEKVLGEEYPVLASYVEYKVCYLSDDFISVVYEDNSYEGSEEDYELKLRTVNMNLKDGSVYEVKDIVKLNKKFGSEFLEKMYYEVEEEDFLSELDGKKAAACLAGEDKTGIYHENFFVDKEGINIGFAFTYPELDENDMGYAWVTTLYKLGEIKEYRTDSEFWSLITDK